MGRRGGQRSEWGASFDLVPASASECQGVKERKSFSDCAVLLVDVCNADSFDAAIARGQVNGRMLSSVLQKHTNRAVGHGRRSSLRHGSSPSDWRHHSPPPPNPVVSCSGL